jgi:hypothetical protein
MVAFPDSVFYKNVNIVVDRKGSVGGEVMGSNLQWFDYKNNQMF